MVDVMPAYIRCMGGRFCDHAPNTCTADPAYQAEIARHRLATRPAPDGEVVAGVTLKLGPCQHFWAHAPTVGYIMCQRCGERHEHDTPQYKAMIEAWNAHPPRNDAVVEALRAKVAQLQEALVQHNERLRSAASIARRDGRETNWLTFRGAVTYTLAEYRELVTECFDALKQGEPRNA